MKTEPDWHPSQRGWFAGSLYEKMRTNKNIYVVVADLGYGMFDKIKDDYPKRFINVGAAEQSALGVACGMTYRGKIPIVYSITPFLLYRGYEWLRNYINKEELPVKLAGSGRDWDYEHDGFTHSSSDAMRVLNTLPNIVQMWPSEKEDVAEWMDDFLNNGKPTFISLKR
jgi:transketolase